MSGVQLGLAGIGRTPAIGKPVIALLMASFAISLLAPATANATFPGANGKIAFAGYDGSQSDLYTVNPDGTGQTRLTNDAAFDTTPAWSPQGNKLAFSSNTSGAYRIYTMNADGSQTTPLTLTDSSRAQSSTWSPDGTKVAYDDGCQPFYFTAAACDIHVINSNGTGTTNLTNTPTPATEGRPTWSPDGSKIAYDRYEPAGGCNIWVMNADGSGQTQLTFFGGDPNFDCAYEPDWSPDGKKIAFAINSCDFEDACEQLRVINADGSGEVRFNTPIPSYYPSWSPDGKKIAFYSWAQYPPGTPGVYVMNADGSNQTVVAANLFGPLDWQPVNPAPYPRPVGASPLEVAFVQAYRPCETTSADARHGAPLDFSSCSSPTPTSSTVRTGPNTVSIARIVVCPSNASSAFCNPSVGMPKPDVRFTGSIRDVRCASALPAGCTPGADYAPNATPGPYTDAGNGKGGAQPPCLPSASSSTDCLAGADLTEVAELPGASLGGAGTQFEGRGVRITDRRNGLSGNDSATVIDLGFPVPLDCLPTTSSSQGSTCGVNTTANALAPGVVTNGKAAVWQIGQVELLDSGPDGTRGNSDDELFAVQGVFLP